MNNKETTNSTTTNICPYHGECQLGVCKGDNDDYCYIRQLYDTIYETEHEVHRLNRENEKLKQKSKYEFDETILQYSNLIEELQEENTKLKKEIERLKQPSLVIPPTPRMGISFDDYRKAVENLFAVQYMLVDNCNKYTKLLNKTIDTLTLYAETKIGEIEEDGRYKIIAHNGLNYYYNPTPAQKILKEIKKCIM